jgi:uncharacterized repeat protein (TIGR03803 family)
MLLTSCAHSASSPVPPVTTSQERSHAQALESGIARYKSLYSFAGGTRDGAEPVASLRELGGVLYGTTMSGGRGGLGTVYRVTTSGIEHVLYSFRVDNKGRLPESKLIFVNGLLYGTTHGGGGTDCAGGCGTAYQISPLGAEKGIYGFTGSADGNYPIGGLMALKGLLYGTTSAGGCLGSTCVGGCNCGTVFSLTISGVERPLHAFAGIHADGAFPQSALTYANGLLYGVTLYSVFKISPRGAFQLIHLFRGGSDGFNARGDLLAVNGTIYGTTESGGDGCGGAGCGTIFRVSASGKEKIVYRFKGGSDGRNPSAGLIAAGGMLYGTTSLGGRCAASALGCGTIFSFNGATGVRRVLYQFKGGEDGASPGRGDLTNVDGALYGTTEKGGRTNNGTIFKFVL